LLPSMPSALCVIDIEAIAALPVSPLPRRATESHRYPSKHLPRRCAAPSGRGKPPSRRKRVRTHCRASGSWLEGRRRQYLPVPPGPAAPGVNPASFCGIQVPPAVASPWYLRSSAAFPFLWRSSPRVIGQVASVPGPVASEFSWRRVFRGIRVRCGGQVSAVSKCAAAAESLRHSSVVRQPSRRQRHQQQRRAQSGRRERRGQGG
jgi:hypothetical protein